MKYNENNPPMVCMQTQSSCYKGTGKMQIKGVLWHDTGCNNPSLKRYVQPSDNAPDREKWLERLGRNVYHNDWNHVTRKAGMNCWIGKLADGTVTTVQTMPWDYRPWGCGSGRKGSCNTGWIQFEICQDGKNDPEYFAKVYEEACEITAYLCRLFNIDPLGTAECGGVTVPTILCHYDSCKLGLGSNHGDIYDWFPKYGKNMETARQDVARLLAEEQKVEEQSLEAKGIPAEGETEQDQDAQEPHDPAFPISTQLDEQSVWDSLFSFICNDYGVAGMMGNLYAESALKPNNLQNSGNKALGMTDEEYTAAVDSGEYTHFADDRHGYGLAQWTYPSRKEALFAFARQREVSIGDGAMQLAFIRHELGKNLLDTLRKASSVLEASNAVLLQYERPADQSVDAQERRVAIAQCFYDQYHKAVFFRVRKTWEDKKSQLGAFHVFRYAMACADANPGHAVFDDNGNKVYPD